MRRLSAIHQGFSLHFANRGIKFACTLLPACSLCLENGRVSSCRNIGWPTTSPSSIPVRNGHIRRVLDEDTKSLVLHIEGRNVATTYITCPADPSESLAIGLPFLVLVLKNLKKYFSIEITVLDDSNMRRRFRVSNYQSATRVQPFSATMPMSLNPSWNEVRFNLADITRRAYGTAYVETVRVQVHANCRLRRIYFSDRLYANDELPKDYKFFPRVN